MGLTDFPTFPGLFEVLHNALSEGITRSDENRVRLVLMSWLSDHDIEMIRIYEDKHPVQFVYAHNGTKACQIELFLEHNGQPITIIAGTPPSDVVREVRPTNNPAEVHACGFCDMSFGTVEDLYRHQSCAHDPDGIMFSELGLPK